MREPPPKGSSEVERQAGQLHEALRSAFRSLFSRFDGARFEERTGYLFLVCPSLPLPQLNGIWAEGEAEAVRELARAIAEVEGLGLRCWVQTRTGRTPTVEAEARRLGLTAEESVPGMAATADDLQEVKSPGVEIVRVGDAGLAEAQAAAEAGFEVPPGLFASMYAPRVAAVPGLAIYLARADGRPVSTAIGLTQGGAVGIFNVGTRPEHRGRGYGAAVTVRAARDGFASGASFVWLQSSPMAESVYRQIGFRQVETYMLLSRPENSPRR